MNTIGFASHVTSPARGRSARFSPLSSVALAPLAAFILLAASPAATRAQSKDGIVDVAKPAVAETKELVLFLQDGGKAEQFAADHGLSIVGRSNSDANVVVVTASSAVAARTLSSRDWSGDTRVESVYLNTPAKHQKFAFVPNDPYFPKDTPSAGFKGQWHLVNQHVANRDIRVQGAWNLDYTGAGVTIGIVDDGLQTNHPDLQPNYVAGDSFDFGENDADPSPFYSDDNHGTSVSGIAGAKGGNGVGVTGVAPNASLAGLRQDFTAGTAFQFYEGTIHHSSGANTNIAIKNHSYGYNDTYIETNVEEFGLETSVAAGTVHAWAAGNSRGAVSQDSNKLDLQNNPGAITVAAMGSDGKYASYSSFGSNVIVTAPSNSATGFTGTTTTDRTSIGGYNSAAGGGDGDTLPDLNYTSTFGGTSSASPTVAGVMALVKEAQPNLNTRFAKHLLVKTSDVVDPNDNTITGGGNGVTPGSAWLTNAAGNKFNQNYGFGLVDATQLVQQAPLYSGVTPLETFDSGALGVSAAIPDADLTGITRTTGVSIVDPKPLEEVLFTLNATHTWRGDLEAYLTSPSGTISRLMLSSIDDSADNITGWEFLTHAFWGEDPNGTWSLRVRDVFEQDLGTWNSWQLELRMGELSSAVVPEPSSLALGLTALVGVVVYQGARLRRRSRQGSGQR